MNRTLHLSAPRTPKHGLVAVGRLHYVTPLPVRPAFAPHLATELITPKPVPVYRHRQI